MHRCPHHEVVLLNSVGRRSCHRAREICAVAELCSRAAAKPVQYDNDEKTWLEFRFKLENYLTLVDEKYVALLQDDRLSSSGEPSSRSRRTCSDHPNVESHTVRLVGDTDHWTKLETGAESAEQKRVRGVETVGGRERAENSGSEIRGAASRATAGDE